MKYITLFLLFIIKNDMVAQKITAQVIDVSGGTHRANGYTMTYSIGQTAVETLKNGTYIITQGFQQADKNTMIDSKDEVAILNFKANIFPNPTQDILHLTLEGNTAQDFQVQVFNLAGQQILSNAFSGNTHEIEVSQLPIGEYILTLKSADNKHFMNSKFVKM